MLRELDPKDWKALQEGRLEGLEGQPASPASVAPAEVPTCAPVAPQRVDTSPENVSRGLLQLVLTITELLRDVLEKQAMRRIDSGNLTDEQIERLGTTLMLLDEKMQELKDTFGFTDEDLNLHLGPLGNLR